MAFLLGFTLGALTFTVFVTALMYRNRKLPGKPDFKPVINWKELFKSEAQPEKTVSAVGAFPRGVKSWRQRRLDLQREHNSVQKQRDSGLPAL